MHNKNKNINVRVNEELYNAVEQMAQEKRVKRSAIVRTVLEKEFLEKVERKIDGFSEDERKEVIGTVAQTFSVISEIRNNNIKLGNNLNQIARALNSGEFPVDAVNRLDLETYRNFGEQHKEALEVFAEKVDKLWHTLV